MTALGTPLSIARVMSALWASGFAFFLSFYFLLAAFPLYLHSVGIQTWLIGVIVGTFAFTSMVLRPWAGWAADRFGRKGLLIAGAAVCLVACIAYSWSTTIVALLIARILHGSGMALYPTAGSAAVTDVAPPPRRGELLGIFEAAGNVAQALGPIAGLMIATRFGFGPLFAASAAAAFVALALTAAIPETLLERRAGAFRLREAIIRPAVFPAALVACVMFTYGTQVAFLPLYGEQAGVNPGLFFLSFALAAGLVRGWAGRISDRLGRRRVAMAGVIVTAVAMLALGAFKGPAGILAIGALYGLGVGAALAALVAWCADVVDAPRRGRAMGTCYIALELGIALGAMSSGFVVTVFGLEATFLAAALVAAAAAAVLALHPRAVEAGRDA